jgi:hypothetical protein
MKKSPYPQKKFPGRSRIYPGVILAAIGLGIWVGGFILIFIPTLLHK